MIIYYHAAFRAGAGGLHFQCADAILDGSSFYQKNRLFARGAPPFRRTKGGPDMHILLEQYKTLVEFLGQALGSDYEVVLHDLSDGNSATAAIANGHIMRNSRNITPSQFNRST